MLLVLSEAALQPAGPLLGDGAGQLAPLFLVLAGPALSLEVGPDIVFGGEAAVLVGGIDGIGTGQLRSGPCKPLGLEDRILETVALVEGIEVQVFHKADPVDLEFARPAKAIRTGSPWPRTRQALFPCPLRWA